MTRPTGLNQPKARRRAPVRALYGLLLLLPLAMGARDCERVVIGEECEGGVCVDGGAAGSNGDPGCTVDGDRYAVGERFPAGDGCNTCHCTPEGVACTEIACEGCEYDGAHYAVGETFPADDGCNSCGCNPGGVVACTLIACEGTVCGGLRGEECASGEYCNYPPAARCGAADQTGFCAERSEVCDDIYQPVCGCDDRTYSNECEAAGAGISVAHPGECDTQGDDTICGGPRAVACGRGHYCDYPIEAECGADDATGTCEPIPQACTLEYAPVCGCDGQTYGNACAAASAGMSIASRGECEGGGGETCGGIAGLACSDGEYCSYPPAARCGAADQAGTCEPIPQACTREYAPVCGCDDRTYGNACEAAAAGVSVLHEGECRTDPGGGQACGGLSGGTCAKGEFCNYPPEHDCGIADGPGTCTPRPDACTTEFDPVCGCDGMTYSNACVAAAAGVSVRSSGECE